MTVYPFQIHLGSFTITGFGIMMMVAFLVAGWAYAREVERAGTDPAIAWDIVVASVIGGLAGAKIYYAILVGRGDALLSRGGLVWYGGFIGAVLLSLGYLAWKRLKVAPLECSSYHRCQNWLHGWASSSRGRCRLVVHAPRGCTPRATT